jgi:hypothetical protein
MKTSIALPLLVNFFIASSIFAITTGTSAQGEANSFLQENFRQTPDDSKDLYNSYHPEKATPTGDDNALYDSYHPNVGPKAAKKPTPETAKPTPNPMNIPPQNK